ncbi:MAG: hypothetical protein ACKOCM_02425 [Cyanobacteriota bacterium]
MGIPRRRQSGPFGFPPSAPHSRPDVIKFTDALPKTRSGKIMRRILRALAAGQEVSGDTSTLEDRSVLDALRV